MSSSQLQTRRAFYETKGLLTSQERDACGFGVVISTTGPSPDVIKNALAALGNMGHRGVKFADGKTGDGAGIRMQLPPNFGDFIKSETAATGTPLPPALAQSENVAVGQFFFNQQNAARLRRLKTIVEANVRPYLKKA
ncbi:MAG: hypothetical protein M3N08_07370, partial [Pseudomonadota bacterium]|nr:hypothetical protein [Pseudomonadota bacterium]